MRGATHLRVSDLAIVLVLGCVLFNLAHGQQIDSVKVNDSIHMLTGKGGNIGVLIGKDGTLLIDD